MDNTNPSHIESLAEILDKNRQFTRPDTQQMGYTLEGEVQPTTVEVSHAAGLPSSIPLPSTVVDAQIGLPLPSKSKKALQQEALREERYIPKGTEMWTQAELEELYRQGKKAGLVLSSSEKADVGGVIEKPEDAVEPQHSVLLEQKITSEDVYLGIDAFTTPGESEAVVVKVELPAVSSISQISLKVEEYNLVLCALTYYLNVTLPRAVTSKGTEAKWDDSKKTLHVRMPLAEVA
ncbi:hypothetical protein AGDE_00135 [Angomonas deanei]|nr:hypothetical protein AGDE_00135 [Angomonas deanei]|eukprot:EPY43786.1 hypothetical protein AGDE_00135 [Angomonas deanei]